MPLDRRVRSYLAANCSHCHRPGGVRANFDARYETPLSRQGILNGVLFEPLNGPGSRVVSPSVPVDSIMLHRIGLLGENQMPPLARNTIDNAAVSVFRDWILGLPPAQTVRGLRAEYFGNINLTDLKLLRTDSSINFDWAAGAPIPALPRDGFSVRWSGQVEPVFSESYTFYTTSDDGVRLFIDDKLVIDNWTDHGPTENSATMNLQSARKYNLRLDYYEATGGAQVRLAWSSPSQARQIIPASRFTSPLDPDIRPSPPVLRLETLAGPSWRLVLDADEAANYSIEASEDLREWTELERFLNRGGLMEFHDLDAANRHLRFYRATIKP